MTNETERFVTVADAARMLSVTNEYVRRHLRNGRVPAYKLGSGGFDEWRIRASDVPRLLWSP